MAIHRDLRRVCASVGKKEEDLVIETAIPTSRLRMWASGLRLPEAEENRIADVFTKWKTETKALVNTAALAEEAAALADAMDELIGGQFSADSLHVQNMLQSFAGRLHKLASALPSGAANSARSAAVVGHSQPTIL